MTGTQLAGMRYGATSSMEILDALEKRKKTKDLDLSIIHITHGQDDLILDYITADKVISDNHKKSLEDTLETYGFITFANQEYAQFLEKRNRVIIPDEDNTLREFVLNEVAKYRDTEGHKLQAFSHASYLELKKAKVIHPNKYENMTAGQHAEIALNQTEWELGNVSVVGTRTIDVNNYSNPYAHLKEVAKTYDVELRFRIEHNGNKVTGRYVDLLDREGEWRGREVEFGKDLDGIKRVEKQDVVTALLGLGPEREDGTHLEVLVEDPDALKRWGRLDKTGNLKHLIESYEIESERTEMTEAEAEQYTRTALNKRINAQVTYECNIVDLENVSGMQNKKIRFGDTIKIKDTHFNPPLYLEARVFEQNRSIKKRAKKEIKLGDFIEYTEDEVFAIWNMLKKEIKERVKNIKDYAEPKKIESSTPPEIKEGINPIWVDTSGGVKIPYVAINGEWVKMSPTEADEVDAYNKSETQQRIDQAKQDLEQDISDAETAIENAQNILDEVTEDVGGITRLKGILAVDEIIAEDTTLVGTLIAPDATILDLTVKDARIDDAVIIDADIQDATITGELVGVTGTFVGDLETEKNAKVGRELFIGQRTGVPDVASLKIQRMNNFISGQQSVDGYISLEQGWHQDTGLTLEYYSTTWGRSLAELRLGELDAEKIRTEQWYDVDFENGWQNYSSSERARFKKDPMGFVHFQGAMRNTQSGNKQGVFMTLPSMYRPSTQLRFSVQAINATSTAQIVVKTNGDVEVWNSDSGIKDLTSLSGISFQSS